jgi:C1A family cysteine protease
MSKKTKSTTSARPFTERICNLFPSRDTSSDWTMAHAMAAGMAAAPAALPSSVDLRARWWDVGDQENTGSCVGWASADGLMRYLLVTANRLGQKEHLSPRYVWMASKETDQFVSRPETFIEEAGTSLKAAADICRKYGVVTDALLPFHVATLMYTGAPNAFFVAASTRKISSYINLGRDLNQWKLWLATKGPILAGLSVDHAWDDATNHGGKIDAFQSGTVRGGHAVAIVGYTTDRFIVRNSWGVGWGDKGFGYPTPAYINAAFYNESYGFTL